MNKIVKMALCGALSFSFAFAAAGCFRSYDNPGANIAVDANIPKDYVGEITVATGAGYIADMRSVIEEFNKEYPNIKVNTQAQPDLSESILRWHNADLSKPGSCPDIFLNEGQMWVSLREGEILKDLTPYVNASFENGTLDKEDIVPEIWRLGKDGYKEDGNQYFIPTNYDQFVAIINTTILTQLGIPLPDKDWTWTECVEILRRVKDGYNDLVSNSLPWSQTGIPATMSLQSDAMMYAIYKSFGVEFFDENNQPIFDNANTRKAMEFMKSLVTAGYCNPNLELPIASGQVAIQFQSRPAIVDMQEESPQAEFPETGYFTVNDIDIWPMPVMDVKGSSGQTYVGGGTIGYAMYSRTDEPNAAWAFLRFLISEKAYEVYGSGKNIPILKSMQEDENALWRKLPREGMYQEAFICYPERFTPASFHMGMPSKIRSEIYNIMIQMNLDGIKGTKGIDETIADAVKKVNYQLSRV